MKVLGLERVRDGRGVALVETLVGVTVFAVALLGLAAAGGVAAGQVLNGRREMARWAAVQQQFETLVAEGYENVEGGSAVVQGYPMVWTVGGTDPKQITLIMERVNHAGSTVQDTFVTYVADE